MISILNNISIYLRTNTNLLLFANRFCYCCRYFDKGLHKWLVRYIFIPLGGSIKDQAMWRNLLTSMLVFGFVYLWHGLRNDHLVWATLNWFGVFIEKIAEDV